VQQQLRSPGGKRRGPERRGAAAPYLSTSKTAAAASEAAPKAEGRWCCPNPNPFYLSHALEALINAAYFFHEGGQTPLINFVVNGKAFTINGPRPLITTELKTRSIYCNVMQNFL
jgi:hypothetical protein